MEERVNGEIVNPTPDVAWRDDEVGRLARAAGGTLDPEVPPDPAAVPLLIDALIGANCHHQAADLHRWLVNVAQQYVGFRSDYAEQWSRMFNNDWGHLTRDLYSCANVLAGRVAESLKPVPVVPSVKSNVAAVRAYLQNPRDRRVGRRVTTGDGVHGIVAAINPDGTCDVVPLQEDPEAYSDGESPMTTSGRMYG